MPEIPDQMNGSVTAGRFREMMSRFPTGVAVITAADGLGRPYGSTCSSLSSVTLSPPTLLACLQTSGATLSAIQSTRLFAVNLLRFDTQRVAELFAEPGADRFSKVAWRSLRSSGLPYLYCDAFAVAECEVTHQVEIGDHVIVAGVPFNIWLSPGTPLLYGLRRFFSSPELKEEGSRAVPDLRFLSERAAEPERPSLARIADWLLGGQQNWAVDRTEGARLEVINPGARDLLRESRLFLQRAVTYAVEAGVRQFIDVGSGLPTMGCVHEVADQVSGQRDTTVTYADIDPVTTAHSAVLLKEKADPARHHAVTADLLDPAGLWRRLLDEGLVDARRPACLLVNALLHFIKDERDPAGSLAHHRSHLGPGSLLVLSQATDEGIETSSLAEQAAEFHRQDDPGQMRGRDELAAFFGDFDFVRPGIVFASEWRPPLGEPGPFAANPQASQLLVGVGRKP